MATKIHYTACPVCGAAELKNLWKAKDYTVSGESFGIVACASCTLAFTQDVPDAQSIGPYYKSENYISHSNTSRGLVNSIYHSVRKRTLATKRKLIISGTGKQTGNLLDVGSGTGAFVQEMKQHGWQVTGLEPDTDARTVALSNYQVELTDISEFYHLPAGKFDAITLWHVLEHVHDLHAYIQQLRNLLTDNGRIFIAVPNYTSKDAQVYKEYWAAFDVPRHLYHFSPASIQVLMQKNGLKVLQHKPMWYDSFYISLLSSKYKNGKTNWIGAAWNGFTSNLKALGDVKKCSSVIYVIGK
ncbi:MAG: class I SAM-dependent methyltransferase [Chitinophagaceae bacterium]|nr:class I SAM-dependent methyltransferase [Chitinophagaceae bacterium]